MLMKRKLNELGKENYLKRQMLAKVKSKFQPFPGGPLASERPENARAFPGHQSLHGVLYEKLQISYMQVYMCKCFSKDLTNPKTVHFWGKKWISDY